MNSATLTKCPRCNGAMTYETVFSPKGWFGGWKCLICGEYIDPVVMMNRELMRRNREKKPSRQAETY